MKTKAIVVSFVCLLAVLFLPGIGRAQSTNCDNKTALIPDGQVQFLLFGGAGATNWFKFVGRVDRSYSLEVWDEFNPDSSIPSPAVFAEGDIGPNAGGCVAVNPLSLGNFDQTAPSVDTPFGTFAGRRRTFTIATNTSFGVRIGPFATGTSYAVALHETTLYNPLWSTFGGFETFYKFYNTSNSSCTVTLRLRNDADAAVAGGSPAAFAISANQTSATRTTGPTDMNVANDQAGHAFITHNCPPGAIQVDGFLAFFGTTTSVLPIKILGARENQH